MQDGDWCRRKQGGCKSPTSCNLDASPMKRLGCGTGAAPGSVATIAVARLSAVSESLMAWRRNDASSFMTATTLTAITFFKVMTQKSVITPQQRRAKIPRHDSNNKEQNNTWASPNIIVYCCAFHFRLGADLLHLFQYAVASELKSSSDLP